MEKVWDELKKIEAQAEQIRTDAEDSSKEIADIADKDAEKLIANSKTYAQEEAAQLHNSAIEEASHNRDQKLKANQEFTEKLTKVAKMRMENAANTIVNAVLGESEDAAAIKVR